MNVELKSKSRRELTPNSSGLKCPGIWPGIVEAVNDPIKKGRIIVRVPQIHGPLESPNHIPTSQLIWALPCFPATGVNSGSLIVPELGAGVWVMFVQGDVRYPVWLGGWLSNTDVVSEFAQGYSNAPESYVIKNPSGNSMVLSSTTAVLKTPDKSLILNELGASLNTQTQSYIMNEALGEIENKAINTFKVTAGATTLVLAGAALSTLSAGSALTISAVGILSILALQVTLGAGIAARRLCTETLIAVFNSHTHTHGVGPGITAPPTPLANVGVDATINTTAT